MIRKEGLKELLEKNCNIDYIAYVETPFQLVGVKAYLLKLSERYRRVVEGIILLGNHAEAGYLFDDNINLGAYTKATILKYNINKERQLCEISTQYIQHDKPLYIISSQEPWLALAIWCKTSFNRRIFTVTVDDGTGSYFSRFFRIKLWVTGKNKWYRRIKRLIFEYIKLLISYYYDIKNIRFSIFNRNNFMNADEVSYYKRVLKNERGQDDNYQFEEKSLVYLGTVDESEERMIKKQEFVNQFLYKYYKEGYRIYIKKHPRDNRTYEWNVPVKYLPTGQPIENLVFNSKIKPQIIIGNESTGIITLSVFEKIKCFVLKSREDRKETYFDIIVRENREKTNLINNIYW